MNRIINKLKMDLMRPGERQVVYAVQGEQNIRAVEISMYCDGVPWQIPQDALAMVRYGNMMQFGGQYDTLPDGSTSYTIAGNAVTVILVPQMLESVGPVCTQVELIWDNHVLVTFSFQVMIEANPAFGIVERENYVNWQKWLEEELDAYIEKVNQSGQLLGGTMAGPINMNGQPISGLNTPTTNDQAANMGFVNQQVRKAAPRNLLDNSDFTNPVNQLGQKSYSGNVQTIDRWRINGGLLNVDNGISFSVGYVFFQILEKTINDGVKRTLAIGTADGASYCTVIQAGYSPVGNSGYSVAYDNGMAVYIANNSQNPLPIVWVALYEGEYTADNLPAYQPKGYGAELAECQRYLQRFRTADLRKSYCEDFRPTMRMTPNGVVYTFEQTVDGVTYFFASAEV